MMRIFQADTMKKEDIFNREVKDDFSVEQSVRAIIEAVKTGGDSAVNGFTERFDKVKIIELEVSKDEILEAVNEVEADFLETLKIAAENIREYHSLQRREGFRLERSKGEILGQRIVPLQRVGIYVPGGTASYPSTVLMDAIPAVIANVSEIIMVTPPAADGRIRSEILAAAYVAGVHRIFKVGGAQAIAALSYGTESIPKVDKIVGPGNVYVATAKRLVYGIVDIDMIAGPSDILVVADKDNNADFVAADLLSQAEHDVLASAVLVTDSMELAESVARAVERRLSLLDRRDIAEKSINDNGKIIVAASIDEAIDIANAIAPEHLELCVKDPFSALERVKNAGSVFLGKYSPEALGDYMAGTNHTLPTNGTARFSSPLSVDDFVKKFSYMYYEKDALARLKDRLIDFATREGLTAHAESVAVRFEKDK